jgi:hypothetical protein
VIHRHRFVAAILGAGVLAIAIAGPSFACSCVMPEPLGTYLERDPTVAVFAGTAGPTTGARTAFSVERWFAGPGAAPVVLLVPGTVDLGNGEMMSNTCGLDLPAGSRWILAAPRGDDGVFTPSVCLPNARLGMPEGAALVAQAEQAFGPGMVPEVPPLASPPVEQEPEPGEPFPIVLAVLAGVLATVLVAGAVAFGLQRRR